MILEISDIIGKFASMCRDAEDRLYAAEPSTAPPTSESRSDVSLILINEM